MLYVVYHIKSENVDIIIYKCHLCNCANHINELWGVGRYLLCFIRRIVH